MKAYASSGSSVVAPAFACAVFATLMLQPGEGAAEISASASVAPSQVAAVAAPEPAPEPAPELAPNPATSAVQLSARQPAVTPDFSAPSLELNVLFSLLGITDLHLLLPVVRSGQRDFRGELLVGVYSDYSWGPLSRPSDDYGKVVILAAKAGYRQYFAHGLHVEASAYLGWRHEAHNVHDDTTLDAAISRLWLFAGWQRDLGTRFYATLRGGLGIHLFRTDHLGDKERKLVPAGDLGLGVRF